MQYRPSSSPTENRCFCQFLSAMTSEIWEHEMKTTYQRRPAAKLHFTSPYWDAISLCHLNSLFRPAFSLCHRRATPLGWPATPSRFAKSSHRHHVQRRHPTVPFRHCIHCARSPSRHFHPLFHRNKCHEPKINQPGALPTFLARKLSDDTLFAIKLQDIDRLSRKLLPLHWDWKKYSAIS